MTDRIGLTDAEARRAFEEVYDRTYPAILSYCRRRTRSPADADDAVAATFLVAWRRIDELTAADEPLAWLYGVAYRTLANQRRSTSRRSRLANRLTAIGTPRHGRDPADAAVRRSEVEAAEAALATLSDVDQELLRLAAQEDLSQEQIGAVLGIKPTTVRSRLFRARQRLRKAYERELGS